MGYCCFETYDNDYRTDIILWTSTYSLRIPLLWLKSLFTFTHWHLEGHLLCSMTKTTWWATLFIPWGASFTSQVYDEAYHPADIEETWQLVASSDNGMMHQTVSQSIVQVEPSLASLDQTLSKVSIVIGDRYSMIIALLEKKGVHSSRPCPAVSL